MWRINKTHCSNYYFSIFKSAFRGYIIQRGWHITVGILSDWAEDSIFIGTNIRAVSPWPGRRVSVNISCPIITSWPAVAGAGSQGTIGGWSPLVAGPRSTRARPGHCHYHVHPHWPAPGTGTIPLDTFNNICLRLHSYYTFYRSNPLIANILAFKHSYVLLSNGLTFTLFYALDVNCMNEHSDRSASQTIILLNK